MTLVKIASYIVAGPQCRPHRTAVRLGRPFPRASYLIDFHQTHKYMVDLSNIIVTGARGMIGSYIDFGVRTDREELDILDRDATMRRVKEIAPQAIIHLAAETDMDRCERDPLHAFNMNTVGTYNVALAARAAKAKLLFVSTSGVFDGTKKTPYTPDDVPNPQNAYAHSKYMAELIVHDMLPDSLIARACWIFGGGSAHDHKFVGAIMKKLGDAEIPGLDDVHGSPTYAKDFVGGLVTLLQQGSRGIFHVANEGVATRYDVAAFVVSHMQSNAKIVPVQGDYFGLSATRLTNESMVSSLPLRPWKETLAEYIGKEWNPTRT